MSRWFGVNRRDLPWRQNPTPWRVWVSEIMLQQTLASVVSTRFDDFLTRFPTVASLAHATEPEVLAAWEGLGYYSRARNLHRAARIVCEQYGGNLPPDPSNLRRLPGIGEYTAAAIRSIAYGEPEPAIDANVRRIFRRLFHPLILTGNQLKVFLRQAILTGGTVVGGEALMELGQTVCTVRNPLCASCPLFEACSAKGEVAGESARDRVNIKRRDERALVIIYCDQLVLQDERSVGLFAGLALLPTFPIQDGSVEVLLNRLVSEYKIRHVEEFPSISHHFTDNHVRLHSSLIVIGGAGELRAGYRWAAIEAIPACPSAHRRITQNALEAFRSWGQNSGCAESAAACIETE